MSQFGSVIPACLTVGRHVVSGNPRLPQLANYGGQAVKRFLSSGFPTNAFGNDNAGQAGIRQNALQ